MSNEEKVIISQDLVQKWLFLVDNSEYAASWSAAAVYFQNNVTEQEWEKTLQGVRQPLGKTVSRQLASSHYETSLPGAPDGEYVVTQYNTSFDNKQSAIETVTSMLNEDGKWKVAGYFIN